MYSNIKRPQLVVEEVVDMLLIVKSKRPQLVGEVVDTLLIAV